MIKDTSIDLVTNQIPHMSMNGSFTRASNGEIIFIYCRSISQGRTILCRIRSSDEGMTWTSPERLPFLDDPREKPCIYLPSTSALTLGDGRMMLVYQQVYPSQNTSIFVRTSQDGGNTWSPETMVDESHRGWFLVSNDRLVQTPSGRILIPACCHTAMPLKMSPESFENLSFLDQAINRYGMPQFYYSDDGGATWSSNSSALSINVSASTSGLQEPGIVCLGGNVLMCYARTDLGRQYESFSFDDGRSWSQPEPSSLSSSCSTAVIHRAPNRRTLVAVWNPVPNYITMEQDNLSIRQRLICAFSDDMGEHWNEPMVIENDHDYEFSHPALFVGRDYLLISYNCMSSLNSRNFAIRVRRVSLPRSFS